MRIVLFGDGPWAANSLERLVKEDYYVLAVVLRSRSSDSSLEDMSHRLGIQVLQPLKASHPEFINHVGQMSPDLCISISYDQIIKRPLLEIPRLGFINFHAGKLPYYRGRNVINWAIINNESEIGLTAHYMDEGIDTGDIILQRSLSIGWEDTYGDVLSRVTDDLPCLMSEAVRLIAEGRVVKQRHSHLMGTYFGGRRDGDEWIDWSDSSLNIYNKIRAIAHPAPGARTFVDGRVLVIWRAAYDPSWPKYIATPGEVVGRAPGEGVMVKTGDSTLMLKTVQLEGETEEHAARFPIGTRFGTDYTGKIRRLERELAELRNFLEGRDATLQTVSPLSELEVER